jgi:RNA polymerase sigma-70 factor, ECF subfamily
MDKQIQEIWIDLHQELKKFIFGKVKDLNTSEDILQDVFVKIHLNIHTLSDWSKLTSWVYQITRNTIADYFRKTHLMVQLEGVDFPEQDSKEPLYRALSQCINQKINNLPPTYKQAIVLTYMNDFAQKTVAEKLDLSYSGVKTRVQRGREKLKDLILECPNIETDDKGNLLGYTPV